LKERVTTLCCKGQNAFQHEATTLGTSQDQAQQQAEEPESGRTVLAAVCNQYCLGDRSQLQEP